MKSKDRGLFYEEWSKLHREYIESEQWQELRRTMPGPRQCVVCEETGDLNLHHMHYPQNLYQTLHCHCVWLCRACHQAFHRRVPGTLPHKNTTWEKMRLRTIKIVRKELNISHTQIREKIVAATAIPSKPRVYADLKPIPVKTLAESTAPEYLKALRKKFFKTGGKKKSASKLKRQAQRISNGKCKTSRLAKWFASLPDK